MIENINRKRGISLVVLVITIVVVIILAAAVILSITQGGFVDSAKKAKFTNDFRSIEEGVSIYSISKINVSNPSSYVLPTEGKLTLTDKQEIVNNVPTLNTKIVELNPGKTIDDIDLYWINEPEIGANNIAANKVDKGYIIDVATRQIYDYYGEYFYGLRWHTLDAGVPDNVTTSQPKTEELWDGWIKLTLYYPPNSTARQWRLGTPGELRYDQILMWQDYTGPISVPLDRVQDVWIKYKLNGQDVIIPPAGTLLVDIEPDKTGSTLVNKVNVTIKYDDSATLKEYRVGNSGWITYTGSFDVTENCVIEARAKKTENIYNTDGSLLMTRDVVGRDMVYIGNVGVNETDLPAPTITRLASQNTGEVARVQITYPVGADKKIYKINYGDEQSYTSEISVQNYGTYVIAYYYDAAGKRSKATAIRINEIPEPPVPYSPEPSNPPTPPNPPIDPDPTKAAPVAPTIAVNPTTQTTEVQLSVVSPANADKVYVKLGRYSSYQLYTAPITVRQNMEVYAYYVTYTGDRSDTGYGVVSNIKQANKPYLYIDANPYPWSGSYGASKVTITVKYSDTTSIEYSEDGIVYKPYTASFDVTKNERIYARGTNANGVTETYLDITNIGTTVPPAAIQILAVSINVNPEPALSITKVASAQVSIEYDSRATEKYYTIGKYGVLKTYTGPFTVNSGCTIYAYAKATNAKGTAIKAIDNVSNGIADPIITASPSNLVQSSKVTIGIEYDKYATIKRYSLNGGPLRDYGTSFDVTENGTVVYAYSENALGQKSESTYTIESIVPAPPTLLLDKGDYYLLKLNYPDGSKNREYKWKKDGVWKTYKPAGIMLIKPQFKDKLIQNGTLVKIEDENGNLVTFTGDYYLIDVPISQLSENLFMRWDRVTPPAPQILINPTDAAKQVTATIIYNSTLVKKQFRVVKPGETPGDWQDYTGPIMISRNNTVIYAKGMDDTEVWSAEGSYKVTNIDENPPVINITADLTTAYQKVPVKVAVTDDVAVGKVKWAQGLQGESYFKTGGTEIANNSIVNITTNGYYTFYAEDKVGNTQVYTLNVTNVDLTPPAIDITVNPENTVGTSTNVTITYDASAVTKQYKVGTSNATWSNYTGTFAISSYTILSNGWQNTDGTVTIYAKGKDSAGNETTVQKKIMNLDLDIPKTPIVNSNSNYATLTTYGMIFDKTTTITYDTRADIDNYYSVDNGVTWIPYTGQFDMANGTVIAKSVKKNTGLEASISKTIAMPSDAMKPQAYDSNDSTYINTSNQYVIVDSNMIGKNIRVLWSNSGYYGYVKFLNDSRQEISNITRLNGLIDEIYTIPAGTKWIKYENTSTLDRLYEIQPSNEPTFSATNGYMLITADPTKAIRNPYQMVTISYFPTSVQRLYQIGDTSGQWLSYNDQAINVVQGQTIYAKGIDKDGNETRIVSNYTANVPDALKKEAYDLDDNTYTNVSNQYMLVDNSMVGRSIRVKWSNAGYWGYIRFLNDSKQEISNVSRLNGISDEIYTIPTGTKWIKYENTSASGKLYEIQPSNEPIFTAANGYMTITADITKAIREPYQMVTITYFPTSVQRLYQIGGTSGQWLNYNDQPINVTQGQTIYAKGIDIYGNGTRITSNYTANVPDALKKESYDSNDTTYTNTSGQYILVDSSMIGKNIRVLWYNQGYWGYIRFLNDSKQEISNISRLNSTLDEIYTIPAGTKWIRYDNTSASGRLHEIQVSNEPTYTATNGYMLLHADLTKCIKEPYQMVTITYFPTSAQKLYKIGSSGTWLNYQNQPIWVNQNSILYAKGIDQYGNETRIASSYTSDVSDALKKEAFDYNDSTYINANNQYIAVDGSMEGKNIRVLWQNVGYYSYIRFLDINKNTINTATRLNGILDDTYIVPVNTRWIKYESTSTSNKLFEIEPK